MATHQQGPNPPVSEARPENKQQVEAPAAQGLLDRIVSESEVARRDAVIVRRAEFDQKQRLARMFANSGCFQDIDKDEQGNWLPEDVSIARAMVKIELGESMGFSAAESVTGIDIIKGRVAVGASLRGARMQRAGFSWPQMAVTDKGCWMPLCFKGEPMMCPKVDEDGKPVMENGKPVMVQVVVSFAEKDAKTLGLLDKTASMYKKDPSSMYFARTITRAQRRYGPGVLGVDALDTYEAKEIAEASPAGESRRVAAEFGVTSTLGTKQAAAEVGEAKIAQMEAERQRKGYMPGESDAERENRQEEQFKKELETAKTAEAERVAELEKQAADTKRSEEAKAPVQFESWEAWEKAGNPVHPNIIVLNDPQAGTFNWNDEASTYKPAQAKAEEAPKSGRPSKPVFGRKG